MRFLILLSAAILAACAANPDAPSKLNHAAGKYRDFADYTIAVDPSLLSDVRAAGGDRDDAHCVAEKLGREIHNFDYDMLSEAVSGRRQITVADEQRVQRQQDHYLSRAASDPEQTREFMDSLVQNCLAA